MKKGTLVRLNPAHRPNSFVARTHPDDTKPIDDEVYVCSNQPEEVGIRQRCFSAFLEFCSGLRLAMGFGGFAVTQTV